MSEEPVKYDPQQPEKKYPILRSWLYYVLAVLLLYLSYKFLLGLEHAGIIDSRKNKGWVLVLVGIYLIIGIALNVLITRKLMDEQYIEYHHLSNTIGNIFRDKISFMLFWVFKYPILLVQIAAIQRF